MTLTEYVPPFLNQIIFAKVSDDNRNPFSKKERARKHTLKYFLAEISPLTKLT